MEYINEWQQCYENIEGIHEWREKKLQKRYKYTQMNEKISYKKITMIGIGWVSYHIWTNSTWNYKYCSTVIDSR